VPWFIKTETFTAAFRELDQAERAIHLQAHRAWVGALHSESLPIASGFLVDGDRRPGGGGLLVLQAASYAAARTQVLQDPLIAGGWVHWQLHEWIPATGDLAVVSAPVVANSGGVPNGEDVLES
jgi:uncharacterized protein YciI